MKPSETTIKIIKEEVIKELKQEYFLISKHSLVAYCTVALVSGVGIFGFTLYGVHKGIVGTAEKTVAELGVGKVLQNISEARQKAENGRKEIDTFSKNLKNGTFKNEIIKGLTSDNGFLAKTKGEPGKPGKPGEPGPKGDPGIRNNDKGQYINLGSSSKKNVAFMGTSPDSRGLILLYDSSGNEVVKIDESGLFFRKSNIWVELYKRK